MDGTPDPVTANPTETVAPTASVTATGPEPTMTVPMSTSPSEDEMGPVLVDDPNEGKCTPTTCEELQLNCALASDGCGEVLDCGTCPEGQLCGGEVPNVCLAPPSCIAATSCAELGWACGIAFDACGNTFDCAAEGRTCGAGETCAASADGVTICEPGLGGEAGCELCDALPDCSTQAQKTRLTGRVITPGRADDNTANQVGVPNAFVYIITNNKLTDLPAFEPGIPEGGTACDRCDGQDLGPLMEGATTDALGNYSLEGNVPVGKEFVLVVKVGRFRRAIQMTLPDTAACATTEIPALQTRLPRSMTDGLSVNIPRVAIATGRIDAMECVFEKMGIADSEFGVPGAGGTNPERVHLYGTDGAEMPEGNPAETTLYSDLATVTSYDMLVLDCKGQGYQMPAPSVAGLANVREYVNRGGRMFASHLSFEWICANGDTPYSADDPVATGLGPSANFPDCQTDPNFNNQLATGTGLISVGRPNANPAKIDAFAQWLVNENAATPSAGGGYEFQIVEPRPLAESVGAFPNSEEFIYLQDDSTIQQYSFNTPYAAPADAVCGRVAYSGFHVAATEPEEPPPADPDAGAPPNPGGGFAPPPFADAVFPEHCQGDLTAQEKVLLYMLFDLGACVGDPPEPPECDPRVCADVGAECGLISDGCGMAVDCGPCPPGEVCGVEEPNKCSACVPIGCEVAPIECGFVGDGCGGQLLCECPPGEQCGVGGPNKCGALDVAN